MIRYLLLLLFFIIVGCQPQQGELKSTTQPTKIRPSATPYYLPTMAQTDTPPPTTTPPPTATPSPLATSVPTVAAEPTEKSGSTHYVIITVSSANVRQTPDITGGIVGIVWQNERFVIEGEGGKGGGWYQITLNNGNRGWVAESVVTIVQE